MSDEIYGKREHDRRGSVARDVIKGCEVAQLHRKELLSHCPAGLYDLFRRLLLTLRVDHLGSTEAFGGGRPR
jgi:hypothetical protein